MMFLSQVASRHVEYYLQWCWAVICTHGPILQSAVTAMPLMESLRALIRAVSLHEKEIMRMSDENQFTLSFLSSQLADTTKVSQEVVSVEFVEPEAETAVVSEPAVVEEIVSVAEVSPVAPSSEGKKKKKKSAEKREEAATAEVVLDSVEEQQVAPSSEERASKPKKRKSHKEEEVVAPLAVVESEVAPAPAAPVTPEKNTSSPSAKKHKKAPHTPTDGDLTSGSLAGILSSPPPGGSAMKHKKRISFGKNMVRYISPNKK